MIAGMSDGVMLVDREGKSVFINPAGQKLLGQSQVGVPITQAAEVYKIRKEDGSKVDANDMPSAQALATGKPVTDVTMMIDAGDKKTAITVDATPLKEDG